jgi:excisionase family DNA binding protein
MRAMSTSALVVTTADELERLIEQATTRAVTATLKRFDTTTATDEEYLSKSKSARLLGVSTSTIDNYVRAGKLRKYPFTGKSVRFKRVELLALITK